MAELTKKSPGGDKAPTTRPDGSVSQPSSPDGWPRDQLRCGSMRPAAVDETSIVSIVPSEWETASQPSVDIARCRAGVPIRRVEAGALVSWRVASRLDSVLGEPSSRTAATAISRAWVGSPRVTASKPNR